MADQDEKAGLDELRSRLEDVPPLDTEPDFLTDQTLRRYLEARKWDVTAAEKQLRATVEWRRETMPHSIVCSNCHKQKGYHAMRQVGFDNLGRPVLYASFVQCFTQKHKTDDAVEHFLFLMENAARSAPPHVHQFAWVLDFTGLQMVACNPRIAYVVSQILENHYPEQLGLCLLVNHGAMFQAFWKVVKKFIDASTLQKIYVDRSPQKFDQTLTEMFSVELKQWLLDEISLNKENPLPKSQKEFWKKPSSGHDPRGCDSYVQGYLEKSSVEKINSSTNKVHKPHPSILDTLIEELGAERIQD